MQAVVVALVVLGCTVYATWTLMPASGRRAVASALLRLPLPGALAQRMRKAATTSSGCGCDGCDRAPAAAAGPRTGSQVVTFHPRSRP